MLRILRNTASTLYETFYADEVATPADGTVNVRVYRADGSLMTSGPADADIDNSYRYTIPPQPDLESFRVEWSGEFSGATQTITTEVEIVGARIFSIAEARRAETAFADPVKWPTELIDEKRTEIEAEFQTITGQSFIPRFRRVEAPNPLMSDRVIRVVRRGGADLNGWLPRYGDEYGPLDERDVFCEYEYGFTSVPPEVKREALTYLRALLLSSKSGIPNRAQSFQSTDGGMFLLATPGRAGYETGIPSVDAVLNRYKVASAVIF